MFAARTWITLTGSTERQSLGMQRIHQIGSFDIEGHHSTVTNRCLLLIKWSGDDEHRRPHSPSPAYVLLCCIGSSRAHIGHQRIVERNRCGESVCPDHQVVNHFASPSRLHERSIYSII